MVVHAFPAAKLGALLLKQVSKPIANFIKERAKGHPFFRTYVCMPPAHFYNWCEVKMKMWILNLGKPVNVPQLNEAMAIDLGANLLGEGIIFLIAAGILFMEYSRQVRKEEKKEAARKEELSTLNYTIQELYFQLERQDAQIRELHRSVADLDNQVVRKPWKPVGNKPEPSPSPPKSPASPTNPVSPTTPVLPLSSPSGPNAPPSPLNPTMISHGHLHNPVTHGLVNAITGSKHHHLHHHHHHEVIPMHLENINKVVVENPGIVLTAVAYLTNDVFNFKKHEYYSELHLQSQH